MLKIIKETRLSKLRRDMGFFQTFVISLLIAFFLTFFEFFKDLIDGTKAGVGILVFIIFLLLLLIPLGMKYANASLMVELKEEGVDKWKRKKALEYINEEKNKF